MLHRLRKFFVKTHSFPRIYNIKDPHSGEIVVEGIEAAIKIVNGQEKGIPAFAFINGGVNAIIGDASKPEWIIAAKGIERKRKPMAMVMTTQQAHRYIDIPLIRPDLQPMFDDPEELAKYYAWLCFLRVPVRKDRIDELPSHTVSKNTDGNFYMQFWDPRGNKFTSKLMIQIQNSGIQFLGISSLNKSGSPELTSEEEGIQYCIERKIPVFLKGVNHEAAKGSFTILDIDKDGIKVCREGNIPSKYLIPESLLAPHQPRVELPRFPQYEIPVKLFTSYKNNQPLLRKAMLAHLNGLPEEVILQTLKQIST